MFCMMHGKPEWQKQYMLKLLIKKFSRQLLHDNNVDRAQEVEPKEDMGRCWIN